MPSCLERSTDSGWPESLKLTKSRMIITGIGIPEKGRGVYLFVASMIV